jgi:hypothetical protein
LDEGTRALTTGAALYLGEESCSASVPVFLLVKGNSDLGPRRQVLLRAGLYLEWRELPASIKGEGASRATRHPAHGGRLCSTSTASRRTRMIVEHTMPVASLEPQEQQRLYSVATAARVLGLTETALRAPRR